MSIYVVVKKGVYRHNLYGPFALDVDAISEATRLALTDSDCYHEYQVVQLNGGREWPIGSVQASPDDGLVGKPARAEFKEAS